MMQQLNLVEYLRATVRPFLALASGLTLIVVCVLAWWNGTTPPAWLIAILAAPSGAWGIDRTITKHKIPQGGNDNV